MSDPEKPHSAPKVGRLLINVKELGEVLGCSRARVFTLLREEAIPKPIKLAQANRWRFREIEAWINADCPDLSRWNYTPTLVPKLEALRDQLTREVSELQRQRDALRR